MNQADKKRPRPAQLNVLMLVLIIAVLVLTAIIVGILYHGVSQPPVQPALGVLRLSLNSYGNHTPEYDARILAARPQYVVDNPPHGLYGEMHGYDVPSLLRNISGYQAAGIKVIGYLTGGYEGSGSASNLTSSWYSLDMNQKLIRNMAELDHVDGIFIDECSAFPSPTAKQYLKSLTSLIHSYGLLAWGNAGQDNFDPWFFTEGDFDLMQSTENWHGQNLSPVQKQWGYRISVTGYSPAYTASDAFRLTLDAWKKGIAYCYISQVDYWDIAPWFEDYVTLLKVNQQEYMEQVFLSGSSGNKK